MNVQKYDYYMDIDHHIDYHIDYHIDHHIDHHIDLCHYHIGYHTYFRRVLRHRCCKDIHCMNQCHNTNLKNMDIVIHSNWRNIVVVYVVLDRRQLDKNLRISKDNDKKFKTHNLQVAEIIKRSTINLIIAITVLCKVIYVYSVCV